MDNSITSDPPAAEPAGGDLEWLRAHLAGLQAEISRQNAQIQALQMAQMSTARTAAPTHPAPDSSQPQRKRLPVGQPFDGKKELFAAWKNTMAHILEADKHFIGSNQDQWVFLWGNLTRWVQTRVATFYETGGPDVGYDPHAFLAYLETIFADPHGKAVALSELELLRQKDDEPFAAFIVRFESKLSKAGGLLWNDEVRLIKLNQCVSPKIRRAAVGRGIPRDDYSGAVARFREIATDLEALRLEERHQRKKERRGGTTLPADKDADGDTKMTGINSTRTTQRRSGSGKTDENNRAAGRGAEGGRAQRAGWVGEEVRAARRAAGACLRCGKKGHFIAECSLAPAARPAPRGKRRVDVNALDAEEEEEDDFLSADEEGSSGKE
jgi:hypothetical protein